MLLILLLAAPFAPWMYVAIKGWARGEHFYHGLPSSHWSEAIKQAWSGSPPNGLPWSWRWLDSPQAYLGPRGDGGAMADPAAVPVILDLLGDPDDFVQGMAATGLGELQPPEQITPALVALLHHPEARRRAGACSVLYRFGPAAKEAVPALVSALYDEDAQVRLWTAAALGEMGADATEAVPALVALLRDENEEVCGNVVHSLGKIGTASPNAALAITMVLHRHTCSKNLIQEIVTVLLQDFGSEGASALATALPGNEPAPHVAVIELLKELSGRTGQDEPVPLWTYHLDPKVRPAAIEVLARIERQETKHAASK
jgi:hypothetical protein